MSENQYNLSVVHEYLYEMLEKIKQRPTIFLGKNTLTRLRAFLDGYMGARADLGLSETPQEIEFNQFQEWIQARFNINSSQSWDSIILFYSEDEKEALNNFFQLFDEFRRDKMNLTENSDQVIPQTAKETIVML